MEATGHRLVQLKLMKTEGFFFFYLLSPPTAVSTVPVLVCGIHFLSASPPGAAVRGQACPDRWEEELEFPQEDALNR